MSTEPVYKCLITVHFPGSERSDKKLKLLLSTGTTVAALVDRVLAQEERPGSAQSLGDIYECGDVKTPDEDFGEISVDGSEAIIDNGRYSIELVPKPNSNGGAGIKSGMSDTDALHAEKANRPNLVQSSYPKEKVAEKPAKLHLLELPCPNSLNAGGKCTTEELHWQCADCGELMELLEECHSARKRYSFYCGCGRMDSAAFLYQCGNEELHGDKFVPFPVKSFDRLMETYFYGERVIVVLGETGVGKTTAIDALFNYLSFCSLDEAMTRIEEMKCVIPCSFTIPTTTEDGGFDVKKVVLPYPPVEDPSELDDKEMADALRNENFTVGQSTTQKPGVYKLRYRGGTLLIVDTPGINDNRGPQQDKRHIENILMSIGRRGQLHAIWCLLKPNQSTMTPSFASCLIVLLKNLHKDACKNILWVFTNGCRLGEDKRTGRPTFIPGDTLAAIEKFLKENIPSYTYTLTTSNTFAMDNEAFRFLCQVKNEITHTPKELEIYRNYWDIASAEVHRLVRTSIDNDAHNVEETMSLYRARRNILIAVKPLAEIQDMILDNIRFLDEAANNIAHLDTTEQDFREKLQNQKIPAIEVNIHPLDYPTTVCDNCVDYSKDRYGVEQKIFRQRCHVNCSLRPDVGSFPEPELQNCWCMDSACTLCRICGCRWDRHLHITHEQIKRTVLIDDPNVEKLLERNLDNRTTQRLLIASYESRIEALKAEQAEVNRVSASSAYFVRENAVVCKHPSIAKHYESQIEYERERLERSGGDTRKLKELEACLRDYQIEVQRLDSLPKGDPELQICKMPAEVMSIHEKLFDLPIMGAKIRAQCERAHNYYTTMEEAKERVVHIAQTKPSKSLIGRGWAYGKSVISDGTACISDGLNRLRSIGNGNGNGLDRDGSRTHAGHTASGSNGLIGSKGAKGQRVHGRK